MNNLTVEQSNIIDAVMSSTSDNQIIAVNAVAGSGKTSTARAIVNAYKPKNGFYTAFNRAIVADSASKFGNLLEAKTIHALAYKYIRPKKQIEDFTYDTIKENISYEEKADIRDILDDFYRSSEINVEDYVKSCTDNTVIQELVVYYANQMLEEKISPTFNYMLKCLHIMMEHKEIEIDYDIVILDECQDTTAVTLEIFKLINAQKKIMLGDSYQNIYSFMDTVNGFEELKSDIIPLKLTKSFRCNDQIANIVEEFGTKYLEEGFLFKGNTDIVPNDSIYEIAYISRTNAMLIKRMYDLLYAGRAFSLTRPVNEIFALPIALLNAANGMPVYDKKYKYLEKEYKKFQQERNKYTNFYEYIILTTQDTLIENTVKILTGFAAKRINLYQIKKDVSNMKPNKNIILTTAHAFKGLEMDNVYIEEDLNNSVNSTILLMKEMATMGNVTSTEIRGALTKEDKEDLNTYYVALSRAKSSLMHVNYIP